MTGGTNYTVDCSPIVGNGSQLLGLSVMQYSASNANGWLRRKTGTSAGSDNLGAWGHTVTTGQVGMSTPLVPLNGATTYYTVSDIATSNSYDWLVAAYYKY